MPIAKLNLCQLDGPIKFGLKMEDCQNSLDSESNDDNERDQSTFPVIKGGGVSIYIKDCINLKP